jgi:hypothetical protein
VQDKTHSRFLTPEQTGVARQQIEAGQAFRAALVKYWEGCEDWADCQLEVVPFVPAKLRQNCPNLFDSLLASPTGFEPVFSP